MRILRTRRGQASVLLVVCLALFLTRPGANWLRARIVRSISLALGRQVEVGSVNLRLLPQPGFDLQNFVVHDDAAFSPEPVLQAQQVTAAIRLTSVLRGRLEIARLNLIEPSFNLVRSADGHWNIENLLQRAAQTPALIKTRTELRPAFPYIAADHGRINFKLGEEKKPYSLTEADFALWQDSEDGLAVRLVARPVRTDFNLTDTGLLRLEGSWQKAATLRETPLQFSVQWEQAQLGQATKLTYGNDKGWRGVFAVSSRLTGTPGDLSVITDASVQDFRRYDLTGAGLRLAAHCEGRYRAADHRVSELACQAPVGDGLITLNGSFAVLPGWPAYQLALDVRNVPLQSLVALAQRAKKNLPSDLIATGKVDASFALARQPTQAGGRMVWRGAGETSGFRLSSKLAGTELDLGQVPFQPATGESANFSLGSSRGAENSGQLSEPRVNLGPFTLGLGRPTPVKIGGWISRTAYDFTIAGDSDLQRLLRGARAAGLPASQFSADGWAKVALEVGGSWIGFAAPEITGRAQLRSLRAEVRGMNAPLEIAAANVVVAPETIQVSDLTASAGGSQWQGSLTLARPCATPATCVVRFDLRAGRIVTDDLQALFIPRSGTRPWYRFLSPAQPQGTPFFSSIRAAGTVRANQFVIHKLTASRVSAMVHLQNGLLQLSDLRGDVLGGKHRGEWKADFSGGTPVYSGSGILEGLALDQVATAMHDDWVSGAATASYRATASGTSAPQLLSSGDADLQIEAHDGSLPHIMLSGATGKVHINHFTGHLLLRKGSFEIEQGKLEAPAGIYQVSGTASLGRVLNLKLAREGGPGFSVTGTLAAPRVMQAPETRAALKP